MQDVHERGFLSMGKGVKKMGRRGTRCDFSQSSIRKTRGYCRKLLSSPHFKSCSSDDLCRLAPMDNTTM